MPPASGPSRSWARMVTCRAASVNRADDEILQRFDVVGVDDLRVDRDAHHLATALHGDLDQATAGLAVHLGVGELLLGLHQLLLHLLRLREECRHIGLASGLHDRSPCVLVSTWFRSLACGGLAFQA